MVITSGKTPIGIVIMDMTTDQDYSLQIYPQPRMEISKRRFVRRSEFLTGKATVL